MDCVLAHYFLGTKFGLLVLSHCCAALFIFDHSKRTISQIQLLFEGRFANKIKENNWPNWWSNSIPSTYIFLPPRAVSSFPHSIPLLPPQLSSGLGPNSRNWPITGALRALHGRPLKPGVFWIDKGTMAAAQIDPWCSRQLMISKKEEVHVKQQPTALGWMNGQKGSCATIDPLSPRAVLPNSAFCACRKEKSRSSARRHPPESILASSTKSPSSPFFPSGLNEQKQKQSAWFTNPGKRWLWTTNQNQQKKETMAAFIHSWMAAHPHCFDHLGFSTANCRRSASTTTKKKQFGCSLRLTLSFPQSLQSADWSKY